MTSRVSDMKQHTNRSERCCEVKGGWKRKLCVNDDFPGISENNAFNPEPCAGLKN